MSRKVKLESTVQHAGEVLTTESKEPRRKRSRTWKMPDVPLLHASSQEAKKSLTSRDERTMTGASGMAGLHRTEAEQKLNDLSVFRAAGKALLAQHTVGAPPVPYKAARARLTRFHEEAKSWTPEALTQAAGERPELLDAALSFLAYRFTPIGFEEIGADPNAPEATRVAIRLVQEMDDARKTRFLEEVVFNVAHPENHQALWPAIIASLDPMMFEAKLLARAGGDNELHAHNALALPPHVFGRTVAFQLSREGKADLIEMARRRLHDPGTNTLLRMKCEEALRAA